ncbi:MAG: hypothetical protein ABID84_03135 [Chloroflexota bacterium]
MSHNISGVGSALVLCLSLLTLTGCSKDEELSPALVLEKADAATQEVTSYHFTMSYAVTAEGVEKTTVVIEGEGDYLALDRMRVEMRMGITPDQRIQEQITIGNTRYTRDSESSLWSMRELPEDRPSAWGYLEDFMNASAEDVAQLDSENIDGVECWHYRISIDPLEKQVQTMEEETDLEMKERLRELVEIMRQREITQEKELWIGKEDYLVRQNRFIASQKTHEGDDLGFQDVTLPEGTRFTMTTTTKLSGFNEPVEIEAPTGVAD